MQRNLRNMSRNVETVFLSEYGKRGEKWAVGEISEAFSGGADRYVRILHNGREIFRSDDMHNPPVVIDTIPLPSSGFIGVTRFPQIGGGILQFTDQYEAPDGQRFTVITGATQTTMLKVLRSLAWVLLAICPIVLLLAAVAEFLLILCGPLRPVLVLTQRTEHIGRDHPGERLPVPGTGDELQRLAIALNRMIERLEDALAHNHRFSADASHEASHAPHDHSRRVGAGDPGARFVQHCRGCHWFRTGRNRSHVADRAESYGDGLTSIPAASRWNGDRSI